MNKLKGILYSTIRFLREVKIEMKRVNWPTKKEVLNYTVVVVIISFIVGVYLGSLDLFFQWVLAKFV